MKSIAIIGGGPAGIEASNTLAMLGFSVTLIERSALLGGRLNQWHTLFPRLSFAEDLRMSLAENIHPAVNTVFGAHILGVEKNDDGFAVYMNNDRLITANAIMLTSGFDLFDAARKEEYGYGIYDNVVTSVELEEIFRKEKPLVTHKGKTPERIGFIHCVGSRDEKVGNLHCSKVCCATAIKQAIAVKQKFPGAEVFLFYMDLRMFGRHFEELYREAQYRHGIQFIRARLSEAFENPDGSLQIRIEDTLLSKPLKMKLDLLVLMVGIQAARNRNNPVDMIGIQRDRDGFPFQDELLTSFGKTNIPGVFCAGGVNGPKTLLETISEARAVAYEVGRFLGNTMAFAEHDRVVVGL